MRKIAIMLGCAALLSSAAVGDQLYRVEFRFAKNSVDFQSFRREREQCIDATSTRHKPTQEAIGGELNASLGPLSRGTQGTMIVPVPTYDHHAAAFYQCMTAKGYRTDPSGPFVVSLPSRL